MEETEGKTDWNAVAKKTGLYKGGKFVRQAFNIIKAKYGSASALATGDVIPASPKSTKKAISKKRGKASDEADDATPRKKVKALVKKSAESARSEDEVLKENKEDSGEED
ncbi:hypothetical protein H2198_006321 [Neophaeococcomyces mojaviensis]|uniref:Uncharacterized protein n=1 Tax=Neophaeococcomyces mojaviensis TaxID=3383035 RepID=A0ACC3A3T8_9EURO|nr:hypothetical protein H2198_006321 [Knufia sp. JES_112]